MQNPYEVTGESVTQDYSVSVADDYITASMGRRFGNLILDGIFLQFVQFVTFFIWGAILSLLNEHGAQDLSIQAGLGFFSLFLMIAPYFLYYIGFEYGLGRTPAKFITGTRVVDELGNPPSLGKVVGRTFCRWIPFEGLSILFSDTIRCWHDSLPKTKVVKVR
ncbi:RDD family protein [Sulfidibacter corallicola]|uniref:RDD family protein n=1 Tax=Sulfidibacter corallicola TaxID=2818388 RepID=A0A8A4TKW1_SULCO|nr:RDD family protein [Sulfidibacter corallicola]QTD50117.1 RDD family protein [Sulfidibacter corallicola]